ncbi:MAG: PAS domain-containing protein [Candidatus Woesearchaeota archaeon]|nr:PAS domain-containing protein [Candidatus Woesearchaeota archaeon]
MDPVLQQLTTLLQQHKDGMSITDITQHINLNRNSVARYVDVLKNQGVVRERVIGPAKLYTYTEALPFKEQIDLFKRAMDAASCGITIADAQDPEMPLIYVNDEFLAITGYSREEVLGKNCRFLQGTNKKQAGLQKIRAAMKNGTSCTVTLKNYTKDGEQFLNELHIAPIKNSAGTVTHYVGVQTVRVLN